MSRRIPGRDPVTAASPSLPAPLTRLAPPPPPLPPSLPFGRRRADADARLVAMAPAGVPAADTVDELWAAYHRTPTRPARDRLVEHYRPLVHAVAGRTAARLPVHVDVADLIQAGMFGLLEAVERYDPERCPRFESFAAPRIRGAVLDELRALDWVPRTLRMRAREADRAREHLTVRLRRVATEREVADALHLAPRELRDAAPPQLLSVEALCESVGAGLDPFPDQGPDPATTAVERETRRRLWRAVAQLGERDRLVVRLYYLEDRTLAEIGRVLGVTESRVCQVHTRLVRQLRGWLDERAAG